MCWTELNSSTARTLKRWHRNLVKPSPRVISFTSQFKRNCSTVECTPYCSLGYHQQGGNDCNEREFPQKSYHFLFAFIISSRLNNHKEEKKKKKKLPEPELTCIIILLICFNNLQNFKNQLQVFMLKPKNWNYQHKSNIWYTSLTDQFGTP